MSSVLLPLLLYKTVTQAEVKELPHFNLETELRLARLEGFPIDFQDIRRRTSIVADEENAAIPLQKIKISRDILGEVDKITFTSIKNHESRLFAQSVIDDNQDVLKSITESTSKPGYFVDRKWEDGIFVIFPDITNLMNIRKLLTKAIIVESERGNHDQCLVYAESITQLSSYILGPNISNIIVHEGFYETYVRILIQLASRFPNELRYTKYLRKSIENWPINLRLEGFKCGLPQWLKLYDDLKNRNSVKSNSILTEALEIDFNEVVEGGQEPEFTLGKAALVNAFRIAVHQAKKSDPGSRMPLAGAFANAFLLSSGNPNFANNYFLLFTYFLPLNDFTSFVIPERKLALYKQAADVLSSMKYDAGEDEVLSDRGELLTIIRSISDGSITLTLKGPTVSDDDELSITFPLPDK
ncbi:hypothetical protein CCB80_07790 [Armatimonadetes bacterium Uphvl-Ar1]|nr:hypothetical protein CCB80_07790 [Armatimonadetes bacterium Uphvl-Ar1]